MQVPVTLIPFRDPTGELASHGQSGPLWFLAGNNGGTSVRRATIPEGKALFFPIMNLGWFQFATDPPVTPECIADNYSCIRDPIKGVQDNPRLLKCDIEATDFTLRLSRTGGVIGGRQIRKDAFEARTDAFSHRARHGR